MDWSTVLSFVQPSLLILIVFLWALGLFLKKAPWFQAEWMIPFILLAVSVAITIVYMAIVLKLGFVADVIVSAIIQSVIIAAIAVFGNELLKQGFTKRKEDQVQ